MILHIFMTTVVPIFLLVLIGYFMDKKFHMDVDTLSKINFYVVSPAFLFTNTYSYTVSGESAQVVWLTIIGFAATWIASMIFEKALGLSREKSGIFRNAVLFNNCGNIGVPLIVFIYSNEPFLQKRFTCMVTGGYRHSDCRIRLAKYCNQQLWFLLCRTGQNESYRCD